MTGLVCVNGSASGGSTTVLAGAFAEAARLQGRSVRTLDLREGVAWCDGRAPADYEGATRDAIDAIEDSRACVLVTPVYRGAYSGRLKNFLDLLPVGALAGKPVALAASGGNRDHRLSLDFALRPVVAQFGAWTLPETVYAVPGDFTDGAVGDTLRERVAAAVSRLWEACG
jgi:FMN reductase